MGGGPLPLPSDDQFSDRSSGDAVEVSHRNPSNYRDPLRVEDSLWSERGSTTEREEGREEKAKLLYSKSKVYLHPSSYLRDNIPGWLTIVEIPPTPSASSNKYLLAWIPEASIEGTDDYESYVMVELWERHENEPTLIHPPPPPSPHTFSIPLSTLYSMNLSPPTIASWYGSVSFSIYDGETLPPLYFHDEESRSTVLDRERRGEMLGAMGGVEGWSPGSHGAGTSKIPPSWGGESLLSQLRLYCKVLKSHLEPNLFLINPSNEDREVHELDLWDDEVVPLGRLKGLGLGGGEVERRGGGRGEEGEGEGKGKGKRNSILHRSLAGRGEEWPDEVGEGGSGGMDNFTFNVFNSFSRISRGARNLSNQAASSVLSHPLAKPLLKTIPHPITQAKNVEGELLESQGGSYDAARVYLAKWARVVAEEGERARRREVRLGKEVGEDEETGAWEVLSTTYHITRPKCTRAANTPIVVTEWAAWFDDSGKLMLTEAEAKKRIFQRGLAEDVRKDVWPFLLKVFEWDSTTKDRIRVKREKTIEYERLRAIWIDNEEFQDSDRYAEESHRIVIDCLRTDRTHPMFASAPDPEVSSPEYDSPHPPSNGHVIKTQEILTTYVFASTGRDYVQGMSDLLSPVYVVAEADEVLAYWGFCELMERMKGNFLRDQSGMKRQLSELQALLALMDKGLHKHLENTGSLNLFFCFRWILCGFKRELSFDATLQLWEVLWTDYLGTHFHLFFALAIIEAHRDVIIRYLREFDEVLKYVNELAQTLDVEALLADAEVLYYSFRKVLESSDRKKAEKEERKLLTANASGLRRRGEGSLMEINEVEVEEIDEILRSLVH